MFVACPHSKTIMYTMGNTVQNQPLVVRRLYKIMALYGHFPSLQLITYCFSLISRTTSMPSCSTKVLFLWLIMLQYNAVLETHIHFLNWARHISLWHNWYGICEWDNPCTLCLETTGMCSSHTLTISFRGPHKNNHWAGLSWSLCSICNFCEAFTHRTQEWVTT